MRFKATHLQITASSSYGVNVTGAACHFRIYNTIVKSILTYECGAWRMTEKEKGGNRGGGNRYTEKGLRNSEKRKNQKRNN